MAPFPGHHCPNCKKSFSQTCVKKGHMVQCSKCSSWIMPGKSCATCAAREAAEARKKKGGKKRRSNLSQGGARLLN
ncbi:hypothetical protein AMATHDRAFT_69656 [Amanita thiersii Skay4041]|uniref:Uncharacterized protein n=1 Tax=Amanita thiersii Skay4041 TaxID=703135 RepID=A0A2A9NE41_9AGAR|nr:hypothetical protein AMATHDRAFT_69656 [Amanita thiersii Skay4041]